MVAAGNVIPLLAPGTLADTVQRLAAVLAPGGLLVAGFGLSPAQLPAGCPVTPATDYLAAVRRGRPGRDSPARQLGRRGGADRVPGQRPPQA